MAVIWSSTFTEASLTAATAHTPDVAGTGMTEQFNNTSSGRIYEIKAGSGELDPTSSEVDDTIIVTVDPTPTTADVDIELTMSGEAATDKSHHIVARFTKGATMWTNSSFYSANILSENDTSDKRLTKWQSGTSTELNTTDQANDAVDVILFEVRDATKKIYIDSIEVLSTTNNDITGAAEAGVMAGDWDNSDGAFRDVGGAFEISEMVVTEVSAAGNTRRYTLTTLGVG